MTRPLVLSAHEVRAALRGDVLVVRPMTPQPEHSQVYDWKGGRLHDSEYRVWCWRQHVGADNWDGITQQIGHACPLGSPGERLWVREQLRGDGQPGDRRVGITRYGADGEMVLPNTCCGMVVCDCGDGGVVWDQIWDWRRPVLPATACPRWASRLTVEVASVECRRVSTISEEEAKACGEITFPFGNAVMQPPALMGFRLWWEDRRCSWENWAWFVRVRPVGVEP